MPDQDQAVRTLADALLAEITRVRDIIMPNYILLERGSDESDRRAVAPALAMMRAELDLAMRALAEHDATTCLQVYNSLQGYTK
jgi:hypothetical protein